MTLQILLVLASRLWSNGCVFDELPDARLGALRPVKATKVKLVSESLSVVIEGDSARVLARYHLRNDGDTLRGTYGAPIDFLPAEMVESESLDSSGWDGRNFHKATLSLDGGEALALNGKGKATFLRKEKRGRWEAEFRRKWFTRSLKIPPGDHRLDLRVTSTASHVDESIKGDELLNEYSKRTLWWDLSPAANWGDGKAGSLVVTIDASALDRDSIRYSFAGLPMVKAAGMWTFRAESFDLARSKNLRLEWDPDRFLKERNIENLAWRNPPWRASVNLESYPVSALFDGDPATAWVAPNGGRGAWLEVDLPDSIEIGSVLVCPGFAKSQKQWTENDRLKVFTVRARAKGKSPQEAVAVSTRTWRIDSIPKSRAGFQKLSRSCDCDGKSKGGVWRIEIDSTLPGTRSRDLPLSEIVLLRCPCETWRP